MKIHWFSITIFSSYDEVLRLWNDIFHLELGDMVQSPRGGRGFQNIDVALNEAKLYYNPVLQGDNARDYCHLEFTGSACDCVIPVHFRDLVDTLQGLNIEFNITRLDMAWDGVKFTPEEFYQSVRAGLAVTSAKRNTLSFVSSPYEPREDGQFGCDTCYIGSKSSSRFIRVYNRRGDTRLEFVCRDDRAHAVALDLFDNLYQDWDVTGREHLRDYIDFPTWSLWMDFIKYAMPADLVITPARKVALIRIEKWIESQVSVALSVFYDVHGWADAQTKIDRMLFEARHSRNRERYKSVLALSAPFEHLQSLQVPETHLLADAEMFPPPLAG